MILWTWTSTGKELPLNPKQINVETNFIPTPLIEVNSSYILLYSQLIIGFKLKLSKLFLDHFKNSIIVVDFLLVNPLIFIEFLSLDLFDLRISS